MLTATSAQAAYTPADDNKEIKAKKKEIAKVKKAFDAAVKKAAKIKKTKPTTKRKHIKKVKELGEKLKKLHADLKELEEAANPPDIGEEEGENTDGDSQLQLYE